MHQRKVRAYFESTFEFKKCRCMTGLGSLARYPAADPAASGGGGSRERSERSKETKKLGTFCQFGSFWDIFSQIHTSYWALMSD